MREKFLERSRVRGDELRRYLVAINGGGLIAAFSLAGVFVNNEPPQDISGLFTCPSVFFALGLIAVGIVNFRSIPERNIKKIDKLIDKIKNNGLTEEGKAMKEWEEFDRKNLNFLSVNQWGEVSALVFFITGIFLGIVSLNSLVSCPRDFVTILNLVLN